jgi:hypothetical protein
MKQAALFFLFFIASCAQKSQEEQLLEKGERYLISVLDDPSTFEPISKGILDTFFLSDLLKEQKKNVQDKLIYELDYQSRLNELGTGSDALINKFKSEIDSLEKEINAAEPNKIEFVKLLYKYRAKNKFGALVIDSTIIKFFPQTQTFSYK